MYCTDKWSVSRPSTESLNIKDTPCFCLQGDFYCQNESWHGRGKHFHRTQSASIVGSPGIPATSLSQHLPTRTKVWSLDNFYARVLKFLWLDDPNLDKNPHHSFSKTVQLGWQLAWKHFFSIKAHLFIVQGDCPNLLKDHIWWHLLRSHKNDPHSFNGVLH